jgi:hypothetical protein
MKAEYAVLLFRSDSFDRSWPESGGDPNDPPLGRDLAELLGENMSARGFETKTVVESTEGWEFDAKIEGGSFNYFVHWVPIGDPPEDFLAVQIRKRVGLLKSLFARSATAGDTLPGIELLKKVVGDLPDCRDIRWLDAKGFSEIY